MDMCLKINRAGKLGPDCSGSGWGAGLLRTARNAGNFMASWGTVILSKRAVLHFVSTFSKF